MSAPIPGFSHPDPSLRIVQAAPDELADVLIVLSDAARWLRRVKRVQQWPMMFAAGDRRAAQLAGEIAHGRVHLVYRQDVPLATVTITPWADPDFARGWPGGPDNALYVLRLAVSSSARSEGLQLGAVLLDYAAELAWIERVAWLRLDCSRTNTALHRYYEQRGFRKVTDMVVPGRRSGSLFQRAPGKAMPQAAC